MARLLIAEDDELLRDALSSLLGQAGFAVETAADGERALKQALSSTVDGLILDLGLPRLDGLEVLAALRRAQPALPVLILTARDALEARITGLQAGADDYLTKPFDPQELVARVHAMLRRARLPAFGVGENQGPRTEAGEVDSEMPHTRANEPGQATNAALTGGWQLDPATLRASLGSTVIDLTPREWSLLDLLVRQQGQVVSREAVMELWQSQPMESGGAGLASNALEVYVHRLRRKLGGTGYAIRNIRGLGYLLELGSG